jgi:hypothetical protein
MQSTGARSSIFGYTLFLTRKKDIDSGGYSKEEIHFLQKQMEHEEHPILPLFILATMKACKLNWMNFIKSTRNLVLLSLRNES